MTRRVSLDLDHASNKGVKGFVPNQQDLPGKGLDKREAVVNVVNAVAGGKKRVIVEEGASKVGEDEWVKSPR